MCVYVCVSACARVRVSLSVSLDTDSWIFVGSLCVCLIPGLLEEVGKGETGEGKREGGRGPPPARPLAGSTPSVRLGGGRGALQEQSLTRAG